MTSLPTLRPFLIGLLAILLAIWAQSRLDASFIAEALGFYGLAILICLHTFWRRQTWSPALAIPACDEQADASSGWLGLVRTQYGLPLWIGCGLGLGALVLSIVALRQFQGVETPAVSAWTLQIASVAVFLTALFLLDNRSLLNLEADDTVIDGQWPGGRQTAAMLLVILILATFMRLFRFDELPFGTWYDEAENGLQALRILDSAGYWPVYVQSTHAPAHYIYLIAASFKAFGVSTQSIRLVSVVMGLGTVLGGYLLGRELFGRVGGLLLAILLAASRWDVNLSRIGMYNISTPLFALLAVGFLLRGIRRQRISDFGWAGLALGLGLSFYAAFQLFLLVIGFFVLSLIVLRQGFLRRYWLGLLAMALMTALVIAPVALFAYENPDDYFGRTRDTSLFADKSPEERMPALLENTSKHLLMFNVQGDPNGRHNMPGDPMLDPLSAALMVLGLAIAIRYAGDPNYLLLPIWLAVMLMGGILSLDFEAPQSLRAVGTLPVAYVLAAVPLVLLWRAWMRSDGWRYPSFYGWVAAAFLIPIVFINYRGYFFHWANDFASWNAFSTPETITAGLLVEQDDRTDAHVISFFNGHPTINFLAGYDQRYERIETTDSLPLPLTADRNALFVVDGEREELFQEAQRLYPFGRFVEHRPPFPGPTMLYSALLATDDLASIQGLMGRYFHNAAWAGEPAYVQQDADFNIDWRADLSLVPPFSVEWEGVLRVQEYGLHQFSLQSPGYVELFIDEDQILAGNGELDAGVQLARGNHALRLRVSVPDEDVMGKFYLAWRPPDRGPEVIPPHALYVQPVTNNGLLGRYFANDSWSEPEAFAQIDPQLDLYFHIIPLPRPYTVEWRGKIAIPEDGHYGFGLESIDESWLFIDGEEITASLEPNQLRDGTVELTAGLHDIRVRFADTTDHTHINLYWDPPWDEQQIVPAQVLFPPQSDYETLALPTLSDLGFNPSAMATVADGGPAPAFATAEILADGFNSPKGVAVSSDGLISVADTGNSRVIVFGPDGEQVTEIKGPKDDAGMTTPFVEPFDLAVVDDAYGATRFYVLDSSSARLSIFDGDGAYLGDLAADPVIMDRARGLDVDEEGTVWIAQTPGGHVVSLGADGQVLGEFPVWPGEDAQPVDVLAASDGMIYVADAGLHKVIRYDAQGRRLLAWELPVANSIDGSHLAEDGVGRVIFTVPEQAQVWSLDPVDGRIERRAIHVDPAAKPIGIDAGLDGAVWVVDTDGGRLFRLGDE